jgi:zinc and cadmium transporter
MWAWFYSLASVAAVSLVSLVGVATLSLSAARLRRLTAWLVSFAVGALMGDALLHLIPQAFLKLGPGPLPMVLVIAGFLAFFVLEKFLRWRHCHDAACDFHGGEEALGTDGRLKPVVAMNLAGDAAHNFFDGVVIAASFLVAPALGLATTLAVLFHEIPQEMGDFGVLVHGGLSTRRAVFFNFLSSLSAFAGALLTLVVGPHVSGAADYVLPITAGGFLYIAGADLIPELHHDARVGRSLAQFAAIALGVGIMAALLFLE